MPSYPIGISYKGVYHHRSGSTKQVLNGPALEEFLLRKRGATWDNLPLPVFRMAEADDEAVRRFKELAAKKGRIEPGLLEEPKEVLLEKLHLTNGEYLTNAAALLFCKDPEKYLLGAYIKIGYFENDADLLYQDEIRGPVLEQADRALDVIYRKYMKAKIRYEGVQRIERYFVPEEALREALLNAICHKQYQSGIPIQISVYEDRLYVANIGSLPENWTLENLMQKHASKPCNPNIAHVFYLAGFIESWGRGVEKICHALKANDLPMPEYTIHPGDIMIKFTGPEDRIVRVTDDADRVTNKVTDQTDDVPTDSVDESMTGMSRVTDDADRVTDREHRVLQLLTEDPGLTQSQLAERLTVSRKSVAGYIKSLKEKGIIERIGTARSGHWEMLRRQP